MAKKVYVGMSGGVDSSVTAALRIRHLDASPKSTDGLQNEPTFAEGPPSAEVVRANV